VPAALAQAGQAFTGMFVHEHRALKHEKTTCRSVVIASAAKESHSRAKIASSLAFLAMT